MIATHALRYVPGTSYGEKYPSWRWGFRSSREACEQLRLRCPSADQIEVVEVEA